MKKQPTLDYQGLATKYMLASTPNYLYKRFRADVSVQELAAQLTSAQLIRLFETTIAKRRLNLAGILTAYGAVIALTMKDDPTVKRFFTRLQKDHIPWLTHIRDYYLSAVLPVNVTTADLRNELQQRVEVNARDSAETSRKSEIRPEIYIYSEDV